MNAKKRSLLLILALVVILGAATIAYRTLGSGSSEQVAQESGGEEDAAPVAAPDFTVYDADGNLVARGMGQLSEEALDQGLAMILPEA